jgi:hypothetical protein
VNRAVHAAAAEQARIRGVDDRVDGLVGDVPANSFDHDGNASLPFVPRDDDELDRDDRPPICPACGVTQGIVVTDGDGMAFVCLECGFSDDESAR